jgi:hypothetical protein
VSITIPVSTVPAVQAYLLTAIQAATASAPDDVLVCFGEPSVNAPAVIIEVASNVRLNNLPETFIGSGGFFWLNETYDLDIKISAAAETTNSTDDPLAVSQLAWTYVGYVSTAVRADPSLGDLVNQAYPVSVSGGEVVWADNNVGRICELTVAIHVQVLN